MKDAKKVLVKGAFLPGLPHLLLPEAHQSYKNLSEAIERVGDDLAAAGVQRLIYYSTQWVSVLGQSFQIKSEIKGTHVDENWHYLGDLDYHFRVDKKFGQTLAKASASQGFQTRLIDYEGFPIDTGTIVADRLLNKNRFQSSMVSCCVYSDHVETEKLANIIKLCTESDGVPTAVICVGGLSGRWITNDIDLGQDRICSEEDQSWDMKILNLFETGSYEEIEKLLPEYSQLAKVDMGLKGFSFLKGFGFFEKKKRAQILAYGPIYGTGNAVIYF